MNKVNIDIKIVFSSLEAPYACIYMNKTGTDFLKTQELQPSLRLRYIDDIFFLWKRGEAKLKRFKEEFNTFFPNLKFTYKLLERGIHS